MRPRRKKKKERYPKKFFFNPPYNKQVFTNVGKRFLAIISKCFPRGSAWSGIFNRHTIKISYSCTRNLASRISQHNAKVMNGKKAPGGAGCNCRNKNECPIPNNCLAENVVYNAILESEGKAYSYYGMTSQTFKKRYGQHKYDFKHEKGEDNGTALSAKVWKLKKEEKNYSIKWSIVEKAFPYKAGGKMSISIAYFLLVCSSRKFELCMVFILEENCHTAREFCMATPLRRKRRLIARITLICCFPATG